MGSFTSSSPRVVASALGDFSDDEKLAAGRAMDNIINTLRNKFGAYSYKTVHTISSLNSRSDYDSEKALYCGYDIYAVSSSLMVIKEGTYFDRSDFTYEDLNDIGSVCPVILGASFAEKYGLNVGDIFLPDMFYTEDRLFSENDPSQKREWKVIAVLEKDSSYITSYYPESANSKVFLPEPLVHTLDVVIEMNGGEINDNVLDFITGFTDGLFCEFRNLDFYIKKDDVQEALAYVNEQIATSEFLTQFYIGCEASDTLQMVAQNQEKAANFYNTIAIITYILSSFGIVMSVSNKIQNNKRNYAIHSLNGAKPYDLIMCSIGEILLTMFAADVLFFAIPYRIHYYRIYTTDGVVFDSVTPVFVLAVNVLTILIAIVVSNVSLGKFDTVKYLKNKE